MKNNHLSFDLTDRVALITGAGGYLGTAMAHGLSQAGCHVILNGRNFEPLEALQKSIEADGGHATIITFDVTDDDAVEKALGEISQLDLLVNNAYAGAGGTTGTSTRDQYLKSYNVSVASSAMLVQKALPLLKKEKSADGPTSSIIHLSSMYGCVSPDFSVYDTEAETNPPFYGAAKAALIQLTRYQACELAPLGIRVNALCPGPFPSTAVQKSNPEFIDKLARNVPFGRIGQAPELVGPLLFLSSEASSYVTGSTLSVDGGWTSQ